jgi:hypothetical protein
MGYYNVANGTSVASYLPAILYNFRMTMDRKRKWLVIIGVAIVLLSLAAIIYATSISPVQVDRIELSPTLFSPP